MRNLALAAAACALAASLAAAQQDRYPTAIKRVEAGDVAVRFLDFPWDAAGFESLEKGATTRSWVIARTDSPQPVKWDGHEIPGGSVLILHPAQGGQPMTFEMRTISVRELLV